MCQEVTPETNITMSAVRIYLPAVFCGGLVCRSETQAGFLSVKEIFRNFVEVVCCLVHQEQTPDATKTKKCWGCPKSTENLVVEDFRLHLLSENET